MTLLYEEEKYKILGACFEVYKDKGCGFLEAVYQECLEIEYRCSQYPLKFSQVCLWRTKDTLSGRSTSRTSYAFRRSLLRSKPLACSTTPVALNFTTT